MTNPTVEELLPIEWENRLHLPCVAETIDSNERLRDPDYEYVLATKGFCNALISATAEHVREEERKRLLRWRRDLDAVREYCHVNAYGDVLDVLSGLDSELDAVLTGSKEESR